MRFLHFPILLLLFLAACAPQIPANTGIQGQVTMGPMCPVVISGQECPDRPYQATMAILTRAGRDVKKFTTDANGKFTVLLAPGAYILHPLPPQNSPMPFGRDEPFNVVEGQFTQIKVVYDSGIR